MFRVQGLIQVLDAGFYIAVTGGCEFFCIWGSGLQGLEFGVVGL